MNNPVAPESAHEEQGTIPWADLPADDSGGPLATEWNTYRHEVERLLAEGHQGRWVLIVREDVVGVWDTREEASAVAVERYLLRPVLVRQVLAREPVLRGPTIGFRCRS